MRRNIAKFGFDKKHMVDLPFLKTNHHTIIADSPKLII